MVFDVELEPVALGERLVELAVGGVEGVGEVLADGLLENGHHESAEVETDAAKGQSEVHGLADDAVEAVGHAQLQVLAQHAQEVLDLLLEPAVEELRVVVLLSGRSCRC